MEAVIFQDTVDNEQAVLTGKTVEVHVFVAHTQQSGKCQALGFIQVVAVHGDVAYEYAVEHIEVPVFGYRVGVGEYPQVMKQAKQKDQMEVGQPFFG